MSKRIEYKGVTLLRPIVPPPTDPNAPKTEEYLDATFAGFVTFAEPLRIDQEAAFEDAQAAAKAIIDRGNRGPASIMQAALPGIFACVEKWELAKIPAQPSLETWPIRPRVQIASLFSWLMEKITAIYTDSVEPTAPNA